MGLWLVGKTFALYGSANALHAKVVPVNIPLPSSSAPAMVLDDSCVVIRDLDHHVMGEVKQFSSIPNLRVLLSNEGFQNVKLVYLGGLWVMIELESLKTKKKFMQEVLLRTKDRVVTIYSDADVNSKGVSETYFGENDDNFGNDQNSEQPLNEKEISNDPFNIYDLLKKRYAGVVNSSVDKSIPYPPGFTPEKDSQKAEEQGAKGKDSEMSHSRSEGLCSRILEDAQPIKDHLSSEDQGNGYALKKGGSILEVLDDMIKVGQTMGYDMEGCMKDMENIIGSQGVHEGNCIFEHLFSEAIGNLGGILCVWDPNIFLKDQHIISDNFITLYGTWIPTKTKLLMISIYAPQPLSEKRSLWNYVKSLITRWATEFNDFISSSRLVDIQLEGYSFTWFHQSANKMNRHLSDHRPILLRDVITDYGATLFRFNGMVHFKKKLQALKKVIRMWVAEQKRMQSGRLNEIKLKLSDIDKHIDQGDVNDEILLSRMDLMKQMHDIKSSDARDFLQKAKIQWAIEGDEKSKFFQGIINRKRANLSIRGVIVDGEWVDNPNRVKEEFRSHFSTRFQAPVARHSRLNFMFPNRLTSDQVVELEKPISIDEIRNAVWACGKNKSPGPNRWRSWINGSLSSGMASILINGSPTSEFQFHCGLKQGDPLAPYLFILIMESLHLSFSRIVEAGIFKGIKIDNVLTLEVLRITGEVALSRYTATRLTERRKRRTSHITLFFLEVTVVAMSYDFKMDSSQNDKDSSGDGSFMLLQFSLNQVRFDNIVWFVSNKVEKGHSLYANGTRELKNQERKWMEDLIAFLKTVSAQKLANQDPNIKVDKDQSCEYSKFSARDQDNEDEIKSVNNEIEVIWLQNRRRLDMIRFSPNNQNDQWELNLDIDDSDLRLTPLLCPCIVQAANLLKQTDFQDGRDRQVNTARQKAMVNAVRTNHVNAVKASACWVWRPGNPEIELEDLVRLNSLEDKKRAGAELTQQNDKLTGWIHTCMGMIVAGSGVGGWLVLAAIVGRVDVKGLGWLWCAGCLRAERIEMEDREKREISESRRENYIWNEIIGMNTEMKEGKSGNALNGLNVRELCGGKIENRKMKDGRRSGKEEIDIENLGTKKGTRNKRIRIDEW
ncbi:RNA-directed DNA polymerase, eukaryota [Tanacetum coccineum]